MREGDSRLRPPQTKRYEYRLARIGQFVNSGYDEEMVSVFRFTTHFVAEQIEQQYSVALEKVLLYKYISEPGEPGLATVCGETVVHKLKRDDWSCDCEFVMAMILPCRHAIAYRKHANLPGSLIQLSRIDKRWTSTARTLKKVTQFEYEEFSPSAIPEQMQRILTSAQRYREVTRALQLISSKMADIDDQCEFNEMLRFLLEQWRNVRRRKVASVQIKPKHSRDDRSSGDMELKREFGISSSETEDSGEDQQNVARGSPIKIRLNPKVKNVGRPAKLKKKISAGERADRKWYACAEEGRKVSGEVSLDGLLAALDREQPGLVVALRRLAGVIVKYSEADSKKPKYKVMKNPVLIMDPFYVLPSKLLDACVKLLPVANAVADAIVVEEDFEASTLPAKRSRNDTSTETILIKDVGNYSREQIEIFKSVENLKAAVQLGLDTHKWLVEEGLPFLPAEYHSKAREIADKLIGAHPKKRNPRTPPSTRVPLLIAVHRETNNVA